MTEPDWPLVKAVIRAARNAPGGGLHREELADTLRLPAYGRSLKDALGIAYRHKKIDFCGRYVVTSRSPR